MSILIFPSTFEVTYLLHWASLMAHGKESACNVGELGLIPGMGRSPRGGHGNLLQYSCLENPMDRGAWGAPLTLIVALLLISHIKNSLQRQKSSVNQLFISI